MPDFTPGFLLLLRRLSCCCSIGDSVTTLWHRPSIKRGVGRSSPWMFILPHCPSFLVFAREDNSTRPTHLQSSSQTIKPHLKSSQAIMSQANSRVNGHATRQGGQQLNAANLAQVPPANQNETGLQRYRLSPSESEPYYVRPREENRAEHAARLREQIENVERLLR